MAREIRFGIQTGPQFVSWDALLRYWRAADDLGYQTAYTFDHFLPIAPGGDMGDQWVEDTCLEGWTALTALGALTKQIRVGCLVTGNTYRHPAVLANMATTVDHITNGRLEFGIGAGWYELEHSMYGVPFYSVPERIRRMGEAIEVCKLLWTQHRSNYQGQYYSLNDALSEPKPIQKPHPPVVIGGSGEKLTLRRVARHADTWNSFGSPEVFQKKLEILKQHCDAVGRDFNEIEIQAGAALIIGRDAEAVNQQLASIARTRNVPVERAKQMALAGTPDEVAARLQQYIDVGVTHFLFTGGPYTPERLEVFAQDVMPRFR